MNLQHTMGVKGRFLLPDSLKKTAAHYGLEIVKLGHDRYRLDTPGGDFEADVFCPSFIAHVDGVFDYKSLKGFLEFLHQPFKISARQALGEKPENESPAHFRARQHLTRLALHRTMRQQASGSVTLPIAVAKDLENESSECHAATEQAMRNTDIWREEIEIGNKKGIQSAVPGSKIDLQKGFTFTLSPATSSFNGKYERDLDAAFRYALTQATDGRYQDRPLQITLSGAEMERLCIVLAQDPSFPELVERAEFEEATEEKLKNVRQRIKKLSISASARRVLQNSRADSALKLQELISGTSALSPIIDSQAMRDFWWRMHFTEKQFQDPNDTPFAELGKEYAVFLAVMDSYTRQGPVTALQMEAIADEFYALIAFSEHAARAIQKSNDKKGGAADLSGRMEGLAAIFKRASRVGTAQDPALLPENSREALAAFEKSLGVGGSTMKEIAAAGPETMLDFTMDMAVFIKEKPVTSTIVIGGLGLLLYNMSGGSTNAQTALQAAEDSQYVLFFGPDGSIENAAASALDLSAEARQTQNYHWDLKFSPVKWAASLMTDTVGAPFSLYKHFMNNVMITGTELCTDTLQDGMHWALRTAGLPVDADTSFAAGADMAKEKLAGLYFKLNLFQNFSHVAFWLWAFEKGFKYPLKGTARIFELSAPVVNLGARAVMTVTHPAVGVSEHLMAIGQIPAGEQSRYEGDFEIVQNPDIALPVICPQTQNECLLSALGEAALARTEMEKLLPEDIKPADLTLKIGGLRKHFTIGAHNLAPTLKALDQFDFTLEHIADRIGIDQPWYKNDLKERLDSVTLALRDFQKTGDAQALETVLEHNLEALTAAQIRYSGASPLFTAIFDDPEEQSEQALRRKGNARFGQMRRHASIEANRKALEQKSLTLTENLKNRASIAGTQSWGGIVAAARLTAAGTRKVATKPANIAASGIMAGAVVLDMAGYGNGLTNAVSATAGAGVSSTAITGIFGLYNFLWDDVIVVHVGTGLGLLVAGAATGLAYKSILRPSAGLGYETIQNFTKVNLGKSWEMAAALKNKGQDKITAGMGTVNRWAGKLLEPKKKPTFVPASAREPDCQNCPVYGA